MKIIIKNIINRKFITKKNRKIYLTKKKNIYANAIYIKLLAIVILSIFIFYNLLGKYNYCYKCFEKQLKNIEPTCLACPNEYIFKGLKIISTLDTLNEIINHKKSISRIGDGEYEIIQGRSIHYQKKNAILSNKLKEILISNRKNLLVGIYVPYKKSQLNSYIPLEVNYWNNWLNINRFDFLKLVNKKKKYYSLDISRFYLKYKDKSKIPKYISNLKKLWNNRDIIFVEGEYSRCGYKNDLFDNAKSLKRIICPSFNAFEIYDKILNSVLKIDKDKLILIALGPTASVLAYDLSKNGYQAIDIGHADVEYEWYLRKFTPEKKTIINHKFIVGLNNIKDVENFTDEKYNNQIIDKILF